MNNLKIREPRECLVCHETKMIHGRNMCKNCYQRWYLERNPKLKEWRKQYYIDNQEKHKLYRRKHYKDNKEKANKQSIERGKRVREINIEYISSIKPLKCEKCGYGKCFAALELHHRNNGQKENVKDKLSTWLYYGPERFKEKINSVEYIILCSNCHRELHYYENKQKVQ